MLGVFERNDVQNSIYSFGVGTSVTGQCFRRSKDCQATEIFCQSTRHISSNCDLLNELTPLLDQLNLTPNLEVRMGKLVLERDDSLKNACVNARLLVDEYHGCRIQKLKDSGLV